MSDRTRQIAETMLSREGTGPAWGIRIEEAGEGYSRLSMALRPDMLNGHGMAHGGMIFALADTAFAYACNSRNQAAVGAQASIAYLAPAYGKDVLVAEAREAAVAGRSGVYNVSVHTRDGRVIAEFQGLSRTIGGPVIQEEA
ncbi:MULTISPECIES: hydroxyphenylacetyl-CoA thioesterase PaaI [Niveispirillum]|uniref:Phenylacetic acid degradation protein PaaD n=2 Tax=Niveispirillum TaxID=1543704 RepID=A0A255Z6J7_9PROT|nr:MULTISPECIES: hydroxyphenylacetyl-CoA thioesterase PaaI [Niveispirillum]AUN31021.1 phenylacetic acid degradation protein PaaD [Niveispirillum cyanobacteriorum]OYQ37066.1 phenylacetic acid degradation protein PaaD [Niveispirillum lacus]GGE87915.1 phenylacetic acid degradation protein PaaD [Niveispirillum cyanobacteriorum]